MLIGAATAIDNDTVALDSILAEWSSGNKYKERTNNLKDGTGTPGGGANGITYLPDVVLAETDADSLTGGEARDYFWGTTSEIVDLESDPKELSDV